MSFISPSSSSAAILLGSNGATIIKDTATYNGFYYGIKAITDVVINTSTVEENVDGDLNGVTIKAGDTIYLFRITSIKLTSGQAILYKA